MSFCVCLPPPTHPSPLKQHQHNAAYRKTIAKLKEQYRQNLELFAERDKELTDYDAKHAALVQEKHALVEQVADLRDQVSTLRQDNQSLKTQARASADDAASATAQLTQLREQYAACKQRAAAAAADAEQAHGELKDAEQQVSRLEAVKRGLLDQHQTQMQLALSEMKSVTDAYQAAERQFREQLEAAKAQHGATVAEVVAAKDADAHAAMEQLQGRLHALDAQFRKSEQVLVLVQQELRSTRGEHEAALAAARDREDELQRQHDAEVQPLKAAADAAAQELEAVKADFGTMATQLESARSELEAALNRIADMEEEVDAARALRASTSDDQQELLRQLDAARGETHLVRVDLNSVKDQLVASRKDVHAARQRAEDAERSVASLKSQLREQQLREDAASAAATSNALLAAVSSSAADTAAPPSSRPASAPPARGDASTTPPLPLPALVSAGLLAGAGSHRAGAGVDVSSYDFSRRAVSAASPAVAPTPGMDYSYAGLYVDDGGVGGVGVGVGAGVGAGAGAGAGADDAALRRAQTLLNTTMQSVTAHAAAEEADKERQRVSALEASVRSNLARALQRDSSLRSADGSARPADPLRPSPAAQPAPARHAATPRDTAMSRDASQLRARLQEAARLLDRPRRNGAAAHTPSDALASAPSTWTTPVPGSTTRRARLAQFY